MVWYRFLSSLRLLICSHSVCVSAYNSLDLSTNVFFFRKHQEDLNRTETESTTGVHLKTETRRRFNSKVTCSDLKVLLILIFAFDLQWQYGTSRASSGNWPIGRRLKLERQGDHGMNAGRTDPWELLAGRNCDGAKLRWGEIAMTRTTGRAKPQNTTEQPRTFCRSEICAGCTESRLTVGVSSPHVNQ